MSETTTGKQKKLIVGYNTRPDKRVQEMIDLGVNISPDTWPNNHQHNWKMEWKAQRRKNTMKNLGFFRKKN